MSRITILLLCSVIPIALLSACMPAAPTNTPSPTQPSPAPAVPTQPRLPVTPVGAPTDIVRATPSAPPTVPPPTPTELEQAVLQQVATSICPAQPGSSTNSPKVGRQGSTFTLTCILAAGHSTDVTIERAVNLTTAQKMFSNATQGQLHFYFHIFPATQWDEQRATGGQKDRYFIWQPYRWLIRIHSFDDTPSATALEPTQVAEAMYQAAQQIGMFPR
jgi:hypothetical protein